MLIYKTDILPFVSKCLTGIECVKNKKVLADNGEGKLLLSQVDVCLDKNLTLIDCQENQFGGCSPTKSVNYYPKKTHRARQLETTTSKIIV
jgi:hypothetical protein